MPPSSTPPFPRSTPSTLLLSIPVVKDAVVFADLLAFPLWFFPAHQPSKEGMLCLHLQFDHCSHTHTHKEKKKKKIPNIFCLFPLICLSVPLAPVCLAICLIGLSPWAHLSGYLSFWSVHTVPVCLAICLIGLFPRRLFVWLFALSVQQLFLKSNTDTTFKLHVPTQVDKELDIG